MHTHSDQGVSPPRLSKAQELYASALSAHVTSLGPTSPPPGAALPTPPSAGIMSVSMSQPVYSSVLPASAALPSVGTQLYRPQQSSSPQTAASPASPPVGAALPTPPGVYATGSMHSASPPASNVQYSPQAFAAPIPILQGAPARPVSGNPGYQQPTIYSQPLSLQPQSQPPKPTRTSFFGSPRHTAAPTTFTPLYTLPPQPLLSPLPTDPSPRKLQINATTTVKALKKVGKAMVNFAGGAIQVTTGVPVKTLLSNEVASALGNLLNSINNNNINTDNGNGNDTNTDALGLGLGILQTNLQAAAMQQTTSLGQVASPGQGQIGLVGQGVPGQVMPNGQVYANNALLQTQLGTTGVGVQNQQAQTGYLQGINQFQQSAPAPGFMAQAQHATAQVHLQQGHQAYQQPQYPPAPGPHTPPTQAQTHQPQPQYQHQTPSPPTNPTSPVYTPSLIQTRTPTSPSSVHAAMTPMPYPIPTSPPPTSPPPSAHAHTYIPSSYPHALPYAPHHPQSPSTSIPQPPRPQPETHVPNSSGYTSASVPTPPLGRVSTLSLSQRQGQGQGQGQVYELPVPEHAASASSPPPSTAMQDQVLSAGVGATMPSHTNHGAPPPGYSTSVHLSGFVSGAIQSQPQSQPQPTLTTSTGSAQGTRPPPVNVSSQLSFLIQYGTLNGMMGYVYIGGYAVWTCASSSRRYAPIFRFPSSSASSCEPTTTPAPAPASHDIPTTTTTTTSTTPSPSPSPSNPTPTNIPHGKHRTDPPSTITDP
ncbi:DNA-directed RNA polymerase II subunit RPB1 [Termitomyces sp. J132]|nr:DNA-directed RNA polymerase II subunit RPB1 [Termitomyces sp. J132]